MYRVLILQVTLVEFCFKLKSNDNFKCGIYRAVHRVSRT